MQGPERECGVQRRHRRHQFVPVERHTREVETPLPQLEPDLAGLRDPEPHLVADVQPVLLDELPWRERALDPLVLHEQHLVGSIEHLVHLVLYHEDRHVHEVADAVDRREHVGGAGRVEVRGGLVEDQDPRLQREHRRERHPLLLAPRELEGGTFPEPREPQQVQGAIDPPQDLLRRKTVVLERERDLLLDGQRDDLVLGVLQQHVDEPEPFTWCQLPPVGQASPGDVERDPPLVPAPEVVRVDPHEVQGEGALPRTTPSEDQDERTRLDRKAHPVERRRSLRLSRGRLEPEVVVLDEQRGAADHRRVRREGGPRLGAAPVP